MTVDFPTKYPVRLTNAAWQASKKTIDKAGKTGLGPLLTAAQSAWDNIDFKMFDATTAGATSSEEALENLNRAKQAKRTVVKTGLDAVVKAMKAAQKQSKNMLLSDRARTGAGNIAAGLDTLQGNLLHMTLDDLEREVDRLAASANAELALHAIDLRRKGAATANAPKAVRAPDGRVTVSGLEWEPTAGSPAKLVKTLITVRGTQPDGSLFINDMIMTAISKDLKKAAFKNP